MNPRMEILSQGEEIVTGQIVDTNAAWLSQQAVAMGFTVSRHVTVGDKLGDLSQTLQELADRADCCICTGGLGPTSDDLTAEAVAKAFDIPLEFDAVAFDQIQQFFSSRQRPMPTCNRKQAMLPQGSKRLDNQVGTAPGFALQVKKCWFAFVPGVPSEMRHLFLERIRPELLQRFTLHPGQLVTIKTIGIGESDLQQRLNKLTIPANVHLGFRAELGEVQVKLLFPNDYPATGLRQLVQASAGAIGDAVYGIAGVGESQGNQSDDLSAVVDQLMQQQGLTLTVVETVSVGALSAKLGGAPWLVSAVFEQSLDPLMRRLGIENQPNGRIADAKALAAKVHLDNGADIALIQIIREENVVRADSDEPVHLIILLLTKDGCKQVVRRLFGDAKRKQQQAALASLDVLRRHLQGKEVV